MKKPEMKGARTKTLIKNGVVVTDEKIMRADLLLENGVVRAAGSALTAPGASVLEAGNMLLLPGGVDMHTHITLNLDASRRTDVYFRGTVPAVVGGTTTIIDHLAFMPPGRVLEEHIAAYQPLASGSSVVDYMFHGLAQGEEKQLLAALPRLARSGFRSVKAYMTYDCALNDEELMRLLRKTRELGLLLVVHAEDDAAINALRARYRAEGKGDPVWHAASRPPSCEAAAVKRLLRLAAQAGDAPVCIAHLSSAVALEAVRHAREAGQKNIYVETCIQYLCLTDEVYANPVQGLRAVMSPPLRKPEDIDALWKGIADGEIQTVATDHCAFTTREKMAGLHNFTCCPGGVPGLEERFAVFYSEGVAKGRISLQRFVECVSANPARLLGLYPRKGSLAPGADADLVIFNPEAEYELRTGDLHGPGDYSLYDGLALKGRVEAVFLRGHKIVENGKFVGEKGIGRLLRPVGPGIFEATPESGPQLGWSPPLTSAPCAE